MSHFILKMIAMIAMLFDHSGYILFGHFSFFNYIGRLAFPIFAFGISEGYLHTRDLKKYFMRLGIFALISQLPYYLLFSSLGGNFSLNIFFTLLLGLLAITLYDKISPKWLGLLLVAVIAYLGSILPFEYSWYGILLIFVFYCFKNSKWTSTFLAFLLMSIYSFLEYGSKGFGYHSFWLWLFMVFSLVLLYFYNGKKGKDLKYVLYLFYPLHLLILYCILLILH